MPWGFCSTQKLWETKFGGENIFWQFGFWRHAKYDGYERKVYWISCWSTKTLVAFFCFIFWFISFPIPSLETAGQSKNFPDNALDDDFDDDDDDVGDDDYDDDDDDNDNDVDYGRKVSLLPEATDWRICSREIATTLVFCFCCSST